MVRTTRGTRRADQFPRDHATRRAVASAVADYRVVAEQIRTGVTGGR